MGLCVVLACAAVSAQDPAPASNAQPTAKAASAKKASWLAFNSTKDVDVAGIRFTLPYGQCESVTGFDLGLYGRCRYFEGFQINILRNDAEDILYGFQLGVYNSAGEVCGAQFGLMNEARTVHGVQIGIINFAEQLEGVQIGIINRAETAYGFQFGGVNVIRDSELPFCPIVNIGFDIFPKY